MLEDVVSTMENILSSTTTLAPCIHDPSRVAEITGTCMNVTSPSDMEDDETVQLQRVVTWVVPLFFGIIGLAGLLGNALVVIGKFYAFM